MQLQNTLMLPSKNQVLCKLTTVDQCIRMYLGDDTMSKSHEQGLITKMHAN